ncbi:ATP phosphoribosyltransferase regulatory subunit [soil metagenome]
MRTETRVPTKVLAAIRAPFQDQGAQLVDPPVVQPLNLFLDLAGEAMRARLFIVQAEGREEACRRPDLTIPVARAHIASGAAGGRYAYEGKAFRAAPRDGAIPHAEEFLQLGLEIYAPVDLAAEAAVAGVAWRACAAGGRGDLTLRLGDAALFSAFLGGVGVSGLTAARLRRALGRPAALETELARAGEDRSSGERGRIAGLLAGLPEDEAAGLLDELWTLAGIQPVGGRPASEIVRRLVQRGDAVQAPRLSPAQADLVRRYVAIAGAPAAALADIAALAKAAGADLSAELTQWTDRLAAIAEAGAPVGQTRFAAGFGRAFGYYDGFLFDIVSEALGDGRPVAGGGRYDSLLTRLGAAASPGAVGCMVRPARAWKDASE